MSFMGIVWMIIIGFVVGVLARYFYPGAINLGFWMTTALGIGGSIVGGMIGGLFGGSSDGRFQPAGWIMSIVGALILLWAYLTYFGEVSRRAPRRPGRSPRSRRRRGASTRRWRRRRRSPGRSSRGAPAPRSGSSTRTTRRPAPSRSAAASIYMDG